MGKLLAENYRRLFKGKRFYIVLAVIVGVAFLYALLFYFLNKLASRVNSGDLEGVEVEMSQMKMYADSLLFSMKTDMPLLIGITAGMLIVQDFRNNTVRNKIIIGHSRTNIYLSNLIVSETVMLIYELAYFVAVLVFGGIILGFKDFPSEDICINLLLTLPVQMAMTALIVFLCNTLKNVGGFVLAITMPYIVNIFSFALAFLNKHEKAQELVREAIPTLQMNIIIGSDGVPEHAVRMVVMMVAITIISTVGGILLFNKSDLK